MMSSTTSLQSPPLTEMEMRDLASLEAALLNLTAPTETAHQTQLSGMLVSPVSEVARAKNHPRKSRPRGKRRQDILMAAAKHIRTLDQQPFLITSIPIVEAVPAAPSTSTSTQMGMRNQGIDLAQADTILDGVRSVVRSMMMQDPNLSSVQLEERVKIELLTYFVVNDVKKLLATCTDTHIVSIGDVTQTVAARLLRMNVPQ